MNKILSEAQSRFKLELEQYIKEQPSSVELGCIGKYGDYYVLAGAISRIFLTGKSGFQSLQIYLHGEPHTTDDLEVYGSSSDFMEDVIANKDEKSADKAKILYFHDLKLNFNNFIAWLHSPNYLNSKMTSYEMILLVQKITAIHQDHGAEEGRISIDPETGKETGVTVGVVGVPGIIQITASEDTFPHVLLRNGKNIYKIYLDDTCPKRQKDLRLELIPSVEAEKPSAENMRDVKRAALENFNSKSSIDGWETRFEEFHVLFKVFNPDEKLM